MTVRGLINPYGSTCKVELELPWEQAEFIVEHGPSIIRSIKEALEARKAELQSNETTRQLVTENSEKLSAEYAALSEKAEIEIARRANAPGQRRLIIKQLAAEYGLTAPTLERILKVQRQIRKDARDRQRIAKIISLHLQGLTNLEIGKELSIRTKVVADLLISETDLLSTLKANLSDRDGGSNV